MLTFLKKVWVNNNNVPACQSIVWSTETTEKKKTYLFPLVLMGLMHL